MAAAIKRAKEEKKAREEAERLKKEQHDKIILEAAKVEIEKQTSTRRGGAGSKREIVIK